MISLTSSSLPFFSPANLLLLELEPLFVNLSRDTPPELYVNPLFLPAQTPTLTLETLERKKTLEDLRVTNRDMEALLAQLRIPRTDVLSLEKATNLVFDSPRKK